MKTMLALVLGIFCLSAFALTAQKPDKSPASAAANVDEAKAEPSSPERPPQSTVASKQPAPEARGDEKRATHSEKSNETPKQHSEAADRPAKVARGTTQKIDETPVVVTHHTIEVGGKSLAYTATAGQMPVKNAEGETEAHIFYMAYTLDGSDPATRPVTFAFNGGPGSSSIWIHMGAMGPRSPKLMDNGDMPPPPFKLVDNEFSWLDQTDLVFIDPVGTGYSRAATPEIARRLNGVKGDIQSVGDFIRTYITRNERWLSPLFIAGESYGTFRAAGLAGTLIDEGVAVNGIVLISTLLDMRVMEENTANGLTYALELPTYTADAWYHRKLPIDLQRMDLRAVLKEVEHWSMDEYVSILNRGCRLTAAERAEAINRLARYTGLEPRFIDDCDLRVDSSRFNRELLHDRKRTIGGYDGRLTARAPLTTAERPRFDPSSALISPPFEATFQQYVRKELGYKTELTYNVMVHLPWDWDATNGFAEATGLLRSTFMKNPHFKVLVCAGYYDNVTPYFSVEYTFNHLGLHPEMMNNVEWQYYEAGHMMYIDRGARRKLKQDVADFIKRCVPQS